MVRWQMGMLRCSIRGTMFVLLTFLFNLQNKHDGKNDRIQFSLLYPKYQARATQASACAKTYTPGTTTCVFNGGLKWSITI